jgi:hypothetical protein
MKAMLHLIVISTLQMQDRKIFPFGILKEQTKNLKSLPIVWKLYLLVIFYNLNVSEPATIYLFTPLAVKQNRTTSFSVSTSFVDNFGLGSTFEYFCNYGVNSSYDESIATVSNGRFSCSVLLLDEGKALIHISMKSKGIKKKLTNDEVFNVVSKNLLHSPKIPISLNLLLEHLQVGIS